MTNDQLIQITKNIFNQSYNGNLQPWFSLLDENTIYIGNGDPILVGANTIKQHFKNYHGLNHSTILEDTYYTQTIDQNTISVYGQFIIGIEQNNHTVISRFTILYNIQNEQLKIIHQQNSYEYLKNTYNQRPRTVEFNSEALHLIQQLLNEKNEQNKLIIKSGKQQTHIIHPGTIMYIQSYGKTTIFHCIDRIITGNYMIKQIKEKLPPYFYQNHRSFIVNTKYISNIQRFEIEMIDGTKLPIPEKSYTKIREDIFELI